MHVLEEAGVDVGLIVGTSVGSLLGVTWVDGRSAAEIGALHGALAAQALAQHHRP